MDWPKILLQIYSPCPSPRETNRPLWLLFPIFSSNYIQPIYIIYKDKIGRTNHLPKLTKSPYPITQNIQKINNNAHGPYTDKPYNKTFENDFN